eukprot:TRINITY_DN8017_c0_g2_i1.p1 TRINITY_DN8017_c0_g2~~TRINITY_DN8017_c0_g2_i1.p1  ORF type:complete len:408 (-),score=71.16 TRINITY_DN8017_c0_g2_i1:40-1263(-)
MGGTSIFDSSRMGATRAAISLAAIGGPVVRTQNKLRARGSVMQAVRAGDDAPEKPKPPQILGRRGPAAAVSQQVLSNSVELPHLDAEVNLVPEEVWERVADQVRSAVYYWEHLSGQSSWKPPPPHLGWWERLLDPTNSLEFFWNSLTQLTVWHLPIPSTPIQREKDSNGHIVVPIQAPPAATPMPVLPPVPPMQPRVVPPPHRPKSPSVFDDAALKNMAAMLHSPSAEPLVPGKIAMVVPALYALPRTVIKPPPPQSLKLRPLDVHPKGLGLTSVAAKCAGASTPQDSHRVLANSACAGSSPSPPKEPEQETGQVPEAEASSVEPQEPSPWDLLGDPGASSGEAPATAVEVSQEQPAIGEVDADNQRDQSKLASAGSSADCANADKDFESNDKGVSSKQIDELSQQE